MRFCAALIVTPLVLMFLIEYSYAAVFETPTGKRVPVKIIEEGENTYTVESEDSNGRKIKFTVEKDKVDLHGTAPGKGRIEDIKGKAELKRAEMPQFSRAYKGMSVKPGDEIRTGPGTKVVLTIETTAINGLGANSHYSLERLEVNPETKTVQTKIAIPKGKLWSEVGRLKTRDSSFEVETPTAVTGVRGTVFVVNVEEDTQKTDVSVVAGKVGVNSRDVEVPEVVIEKGEALHVRAEEEPARFSVAELAQHFAQITKEWARQSKHFSSVTALAGIGELEEIEVQPGLPQEEKQRVYDSIQAGWEKAAVDFFEIDKAIKLFYLDFGRFPKMEEGGLDALIETTRTPEWDGPYIDAEHLVDNYEQPYSYMLRKDIHGKTFVQISTAGYDQKSGTKDDRKKMILEEDAARWGDRKSYR
jgi:hypothetical protein